MFDTSKYHVYYLFDEDKNRIGCVVFTRSDMDGTVNRGISLCSNEDQFCKRIARKIALNRCKIAEQTHVSQYPVMDNRRDPHVTYAFSMKNGTSMSTEDGMVFKSAYDARTTDYELQILASLGKRDADQV